MIAADHLAELLAELEPVGLDADGATTRLAWTAEDEAARAWFWRQAERIGHRPERDPAGNLWACPPAPGPWWAVGSHLDSVRAGGRFDGALGVAAAFAVAARARIPLAVISFADEEGARFNTPTFGSRALVGALDVADALDRVDDRGITLASAFGAAGLDPARIPQATAGLARLRGLLELHIDQTRDLARAGAPAGVVERLAARLRLELALHGRADHAGTTPTADRRDALVTAARVIVEADAEGAARPGMIVTAARIEVEPNAPTTVPERARLWLDARAGDADAVRSWHEAIERRADRIAAGSHVELTTRTAAWSEGTVFPDDVLAALGRGLPPDAPRLLCYAGHDAGVVARVRPAGMVFVRNASGISHAAQERVSLDDAAVAATALLRAAEELAS